MKDRADAILHAVQARYLDDLLPERDPLLEEMEELAGNEIPISDPEVGRLLEILARSLRARRILEIGTAIGYGTLCLARGARLARVTTIDVDPERLETARRFLARAGVAKRVKLVEGAALEVLPRLRGPFDLVYVDTVKSEYRQYLDLVVPRLRDGGMVVLDNLLWKGRVAEPPPEGDATADAVRAFNRYFVEHPRLDALVLPLGDGLGLATKKSRPSVKAPPAAAGPATARS